MKNIILALVFTPTCIFAEAHEGISGVNWGASTAELKTSFSKKYKFLKEEKLTNKHLSRSQHYEGTYAGFKNVLMFASFNQDKFIGFTATIPINQNSLSLYWERVVDQMKDKYGKPTKITAPPNLNATKGFSSTLRERFRSNKNAETLAQIYDRSDQAMEQNRNELLDTKIYDGTWVPEATWHFENGITSVVAVDAHEGVIVWMFLPTRVHKEILAEANAKKLSDF